MSKKSKLPSKSHRLLFQSEEKACRQGYKLVVGIDEAGRGPLAGPVVASAVAVKDYSFSLPIRDSKKLTPAQRQALFHEIQEKAYVGIGIISETVIDDINILQATFCAMINAVNQLILQLPLEERERLNSHEDVLLLVDGNRFETDLPYQYKTVVDGDNKIASIACASVIAKVTRDRILDTYHKILPEYGFCRHKGYATQEHRSAIARLGMSFIHRKSFCFATDK